MKKQTDQLTLILRCTAEEDTWSITDLALRLRVELAQHGIELVELLRAIKIPQGDSSGVDNSLTDRVSHEPNTATLVGDPHAVRTFEENLPIENRDTENISISIPGSFGDELNCLVADAQKALAVVNTLHARIDNLVAFEKNMPI